MNSSSNRVVLIALTLALPAAAGPGTTVTPQHVASSGDWCTWLQNKPGQLYKNPENPLIQSFQIGGRLQYQAAYLDGHDSNGTDFHDTYDEWRRARIETKTEFLRFFQAKVNINIVNDERAGGGDLEWDYQDFDEAILSFDIKKAFGAGPLDALKINYGRHKFIMTEEARMSSKEIITIERSAISNKLYNSARPTGVTLDFAKGPWSGTIGVFSSESDAEFISGWNEGQSYYLALGYEVSDQFRMQWEYVNNNPSKTDDRLGYDWGTSLSATYEGDRFGIISTVAAGENNSTSSGRGGSFHGFVAMPWYWIVREKLQAVVQYSYAGSSQDEGLRTNSRYVRAAHQHVNISGRGDELHTLYAGLNYYLCGHHAKVMGGVEYTSLDAPDGNVNAVSYLIAFRTAF